MNVPRPSRIWLAISPQKMLRKGTTGERARRGKGGEGGRVIFVLVEGGHDLEGDGAQGRGGERGEVGGDHSAWLRPHGTWGDRGRS
jgi:hypothetical protein